MEQDEAIRKTNDEALACRHSAISKGYFEDPFASYFLTAGGPLSASKPPIINRGTFLRTRAIDRIILSIHRGEEGEGAIREEDCTLNVVSFGAGSDSRYFRLFSSDQSAAPVNYVELDFAEVTMRKVKAIMGVGMKTRGVQKSPQFLKELLVDPKIQKGGCELESKSYNLLAGDLNQMSPDLEARIKALLKKGPVVFLFECVISYLKIEGLKRLISFMKSCMSKDHNVTIIAYEMVNPTDAFGSVMLKNLKDRGLDLSSACFLPLETLCGLFQEILPDCNVKAQTMDKVYREIIDSDEHNRLNRIEFMDEWEEWTLLLQHYCLLTVTRKE